MSTIAPTDIQSSSSNIKELPLKSVSDITESDSILKIDYKELVLFLLNTYVETCEDPELRKQAELLKGQILYRLHYMLRDNTSSSVLEAFYNRTENFLNNKLTDLQRNRTEFNDEHQKRLEHSRQIEDKIRLAEMPKRVPVERHIYALRKMKEERPNAEFTSAIETGAFYAESFNGYIMNVLTRENVVKADELVFETFHSNYDMESFKFAGPLSSIHSKRAFEDMLFEKFIYCPNAADKPTRNGGLKSTGVFITGTNDTDICKKFKTHLALDTTMNVVRGKVNSTFATQHPLAATQVWDHSRAPMHSDSEVSYQQVGTIASMPESTRKKILNQRFAFCRKITTLQLNGKERNVGAVIIDGGAKACDQLASHFANQQPSND